MEEITQCFLSLLGFELHRPLGHLNNRTTSLSYIHQQHRDPMRLLYLPTLSTIYATLLPTNIDNYVFIIKVLNFLPQISSALFHILLQYIVCCNLILSLLSSRFSLKTLFIYDKGDPQPVPFGFAQDKNFAPMQQLAHHTGDITRTRQAQCDELDPFFLEDS